MSKAARLRALDTLRTARERHPRSKAFSQQMADLLQRQAEDTARLLREYATEEERRQEAELSAALETCDEERRHLLDEEWEMLVETLGVRRARAKALQEGRVEVARVLADEHEHWIRRMRAVRSALNQVGLWRATFSAAGDGVHVSIRAPTLRVIRNREAKFVSTLKGLLGPGETVKLTYSAYYPVYIPEPARADGRSP